MVCFHRFHHPGSFQLTNPFVIEFLVSTAQEASSPTMSVTLSTRRTSSDVEKDLCSIVDTAEKSHTYVQGATEAMQQMEIVSGFAAGVAKTYKDNKTIGNTLDTTEKSVISVKVFLEKWQVVSDRLGFVMHALKPISEVCSTVNFFLGLM